MNDRKYKKTQVPTAYKTALRKPGVSYIRGMFVKRGKEKKRNHTEKASPVQAMEID